MFRLCLSNTQAGISRANDIFYSRISRAPIELPIGCYVVENSFAAELIYGDFARRCSGLRVSAEDFFCRFLRLLCPFIHLLSE